MKQINQPLFLAGTLLFIMVISCAKDTDTPIMDPGSDTIPNNPVGDLTITGISSGDLFWGDEMVINGTGFSTVKEENIVKFTNAKDYCSINYTSVNGDIEILSVSSTQIKIKIPVKRNDEGRINCGPESADLEVTVGSKKATFKDMEFCAIPYIGYFTYHYGWFDVPRVTRIGDSVLLDGGLYGTPKVTSKYWDKIRLSINGENVPIKYRNIGMEKGWAFYLPVPTYAELNCSEDTDGWGARYMTFKFYLEGTNRSASRDLYVQYMPKQSYNCYNCPSPISKSAGDDPTWTVKGSNMYVTSVVFTPAYTEQYSSQSMAVVSNPWTNEVTFDIPLSVLIEELAYNVYFANKCDTVLIGKVSIKP